MKKEVIVMGKGSLAIRIAEWFCESNEYELVQIVPVVPEPSWTDSFIEWANKKGVSTVASGHYKDVSFIKNEDKKIDLVFSVFYDKIIKSWFIDKCNRILNLHNAPLPRYRGVSPINWALKNKEVRHGVTIHEIDVEIDHGPIYTQLEYSIYPEFDEVIDIYKRSLEYGWVLFCQTIPILDKIVPRPQDHSLATYYSTKQNNLLAERRDFTKQASLTTQSTSHSAVAVVGLGKIGLPLAVQYARHGRRVIGCDINPLVVEKINAGQSHIQEEPGLAGGVAEAVHKGLLSATLDVPDAVGRAGVVVVIVPVVTDASHGVNFDAIDAATAAIGAGLRPGTLVIYETTLPVGTTARRFAQMLEQTAKLKAGRDFHLAYSPERVKSGRIFYDLCLTPKVVGGIDEQSADAATDFYRSVLDARIITMATTDEAEFVKLIETAYRDVNIALANEFACFADLIGVDVAKSIAAANTLYESHIHIPGVGVGGHCIPVYPYFLFSNLEKARLQTQGSELPLLVLPRYARRINDSMVEYAVQRIEAEIGPLAQQPILILGVAYRGNVHETAFTCAELLRDALLAHGARVYVDDPLFSEEELHALGYTPLPGELEGEIRAIILQAAHTAYQSFEFNRFGRCKVVLDGRNALRREKIESLGMRYIAIGDGMYTRSMEESCEEHATISVSQYDK
jgi:nucleotide sugar dehydrogenase